ncbi:MAG: triose-phosphate isomerase [Oscillospiraceae bacterium]
MERKKIIAGNWKMNKTPSETAILLDEIKSKLGDLNCKFIICPPFISLERAIETAKNSPIKIGGQNCYWEESGAYTGEVSAKMLADLGIEYVILGHSERRTYFGDTDQSVNKKIKSAINHSLTAIFCVGESLEQRELGVTETHIKSQIKLGLLGISQEEMAKIIIAYEPIWAIGTGKTATSQQAEEVCRFIRKIIGEMYNCETAENIQIIYGGSMNEKNAAELLSMENIDGGLIGGASLKPDEITAIANNCI